MTTVEKTPDHGPRHAAGTTTADTTTAENPHHKRRWWILAVLALAQLMVVLDGTIVNIALPSAQADLGFSNDNRQWIVTAYALAFGSLLLLGGRFADMFGRKRMFLIGVFGFAAASAVGGAAVSFEMLVAARGLQGIFGALLAPAALSLLNTIFTDAKERTRAFSIYGAVSGGGAAVGLLLGGVLTEYLSWRWALYVNLIIAAIAGIGGVLWLKNQKSEGTRPTFDIAGTLTVIIGLVAVVFGLSNAESHGWGYTGTWSFVVIGIALIAVFAFIETRVSAPLLPLRLVLDRTRGGSLLAMALVSAGLFGIFLFLTYYLSTILGFSPVKTGLAFMPMIAALVAATQIASALVERIGYKWPITIGMLAAIAGMLLLTQLELDSTYLVHIVPGLVLCGIGLGFTISPAMSAATLGIKAEDSGVASAMVNTAQQIGGSIGTALLSAFAASAASDYLSDHAPTPQNQLLATLHSYTTAFWWSAAIFAVGALVSVTLIRHGAVEKDPDAAVVIAH